MTDIEVVDAITQNAKNILDMDIVWTDIIAKNENLKYDGTIKVTIANTTIEFATIIKQEIRTHQLYKIEALDNQANLPSILITKRLTTEIRTELRKRNIAYLEANGNMYIHKGNLFVFIDGQSPLKAAKNITNRAFTKTGLKVIFHLLTLDELINKPYREIASTVGVALGNINYIFTGLKDMGFLLQLTKDQYKLTNKKELLERWLTGYEEKLKPALKQGDFAFTTELAQKNWRELPLKENKTYWAGEPAGDLMTDHLRPEIFTIYTTEKQLDLIRNYKLIPKNNGNIKIYEKFWNLPEDDIKTVPPLLVYADLMTVNDKRCHETAKIIYDKYIQPNL